MLFKVLSKYKKYYQMNQIIPKTINFKELIENSNTTLSLTVQSKLVEHLNQEFTEEQQQWYIANLYIYMHYHPTNDYPINLEHVFRMIGFAHKKNAKRTLENNFTINDDYKIRVLPKEQSSWGGSGGEEIMLNIDTFKNLCMMAKTDKGKEIRKYYVKLENVYNHIIKEELEQNSKLLADKEKQLTDKEKELERTKKALERTSKLKVKKWYDCEPGHTVYGFISNEAESNSLITIGKSKNIKKRESEYMTHNQHGRMFYIRKCYNCDLTEKVLHHILDKYRCERLREWFDISEELVVYVIDLVCDFLDTFIGCSEKLPEYKIKEFIQDLQVDHVDYKLVLDEEIPIQERIPYIYINENIKDYDKFLSDCCDLGDDEYFSLPSEVTAAYRIWCKGAMSKPVRTELNDYIKSRFPKKDMYLKNLGIRSTVLIGIQPKELNFEPIDSQNLTLFEEFCIDECVTDYSYKIKIDEFINNYKQWLQTRDETWNEDDLPHIKTRINKQFLVEYYSNECWIWGLQLKSTPLPTYHSKSDKCNKIYMLDFETREIIKVLHSLSEASVKFSMIPEIMSHKIRYKKPFVFNGKRILLVYDKPNLEHVGIKRNVSHKTIYKFNFKTKELIDKYTTIKEASSKNGISSRTIIRYIKIQQVFNTKNDKDPILLTYKEELDDKTIKEIEENDIKRKSGCVKIRPCKTIQKIDFETNEVLETFYGILDAAAKLKIGECTVSRHLKSGKKIKMKDTMSFVVLKYA